MYTHQTIVSSAILSSKICVLLPKELSKNLCGSEVGLLISRASIISVLVEPFLERRRAALEF
jgi:hypothetical protein